VSEPVREVTCRHCGGTIVSSEEDRSIGHSYPPCSWFQKVMQLAGSPGELVILDRNGKRVTLQ
jgi:hypothetical protein